MKTLAYYNVEQMAEVVTLEGPANDQAGARGYKVALLTSIAGKAGLKDRALTTGLSLNEWEHARTDYEGA